MQKLPHRCPKQGGGPLLDNVQKDQLFSQDGFPKSGNTRFTISYCNTFFSSIHDFKEHSLLQLFPDFEISELLLNFSVSYEF